MNQKIKELKHSDDYKERFIAEARELETRCKKLHRTIRVYGTLSLYFGIKSRI